MDAVKIPTERAIEPNEEACQPREQVKTMGKSTKSAKARNDKNKNHHITFAETAQREDKPMSQNSSSYKDVLSQPAANISHKEKLLWLQRRRNLGLWVQCDSCERWRYLAHILDRHELPEEWNCQMNPDRNFNDCSVPEEKLRVHDEEELIHNEYSAGSVVWARLQGWPWWPAMVDDEPDTEQFYWLDGFSDIPTHYNVTFFDKEVTRAWIAPECLKPYESRKSYATNEKKYKKRVEYAMAQAKEAAKLPLAERLAKYSFIATYKGTVSQPKKIDKRVLEKFQKRLQNKFNIAFPIENTSSEEEEEFTLTPPPEESMKRKNVIIVGTPKRSKTVLQRNILGNETLDKVEDSLIVFNDTQIQTTAEAVQNTTVDDTGIQTTSQAVKNTTANDSTHFDTYKEPNSMSVQADSHANKTEESIKRTNSDKVVSIMLPVTPTEFDSTQAPTESSFTETLQVRVGSPSSEDFDF